MYIYIYHLIKVHYTTDGQDWRRKKNIVFYVQQKTNTGKNNFKEVTNDLKEKRNL